MSADTNHPQVRLDGVLRLVVVKLARTHGQSVARIYVPISIAGLVLIVLSIWHRDLLIWGMWLGGASAGWISGYMRGRRIKDQEWTKAMEPLVEQARKSIEEHRADYEKYGIEVPDLGERTSEIAYVGLIQRYDEAMGRYPEASKHLPAYIAFFGVVVASVTGLLIKFL